MRIFVIDISRLHV